jgi:hypothetical protein
LLHPLVMLLTMSEGTIDDGVTIDCDDCRFQGTDTCDDCVVTFICGRDPDDAVVIDADEYRGLRLLSGAGLLPELRHRRRTG